MENPKNSYAAAIVIAIIILGVSIVVVASLNINPKPILLTITRTVFQTTTATVLLPGEKPGQGMHLGGVEKLNFSETGILLKPSSWKDLLVLLEKVRTRYTSPYYPYKYLTPDVLRATPLAGSAEAITGVTMTTTYVPTTVSAIPSSYSTTNVQVAGVDEQDIVKTNGTHIALAVNKPNNAIVLIYRAYPPSSLQLEKQLNLSRILVRLAGNATLFLSEGNTTIPLGTLRPSFYVNGIYMLEDRIIAIVTEHRYGPISLAPRTWIVIYKTSDNSYSTVKISGSVVDTRLWGDLLVVVTTAPTVIGGGIVLPLVNDALPSINTTYIVGAPEAYTIIAAVNITSMASDTLTIVGPRTLVFYMTSKGDVYLPLNAAYIRVLRAVADKKLDEQVESLLSTTRLSWDETLLVKIQLVRGTKPSLKPVAHTLIKGRISKQWQIDEYNGTLRLVAEKWDGKRIVVLYVLNATTLKQISVLDNIAENERIHGVRFLGPRLYLVTFRSIDPFFAIDLSNPRKPVILGYLEGPGFDEYIHPLGANILLGVGTEGGKVRVTLYHVDRAGRITPMDKILVPVSATRSWSPVLNPRYGHRAFTYDPRHNYVLLPVYGENITRIVSSDGKVYYRATLLTGVSVISIDTSKGKLSEKGFLEHRGALRTIYILDTIYTIAPQASDKNAKIIAWDASTLKEIKRA